MVLKLKSRILILICLILKSILGLDLLSWPLLFWNKPLEQMTLFSWEPTGAWFSSNASFHLSARPGAWEGLPSGGSSSPVTGSRRPPLSTGLGTVSPGLLFLICSGGFSNLYRSRKTGVKKNLTHRPPSKAAPLKPLSPKHFKASPILAFRPVYPHSGWGPAHTKFVFGFPQWFQTCLLLVVCGDWARSRSGLPGLGESHSVSHWPVDTCRLCPRAQHLLIRPWLPALGATCWV